MGVYLFLFKLWFFVYTSLTLNHFPNYLQVTALTCKLNDKLHNCNLSS